MGMSNIANSGLKAAMTNMESISNNIANVNTPGFKKTYVNLADMQVNSSNLQPGLGVKINSIKQNFATGRIDSSDRMLDLSLSNDGFFVQKDNSGIMTYTRNGRFDIQDGYLMGLGGKIQGYPAKDGNILSSGMISDLQIPNLPIPAVPSSKANIAINLKSDSQVPSVPFSNSNPDSYNHRTDTTLYDNLGSPYLMAVYYIKQADNTWTANVEINNQSIGTGTMNFVDGKLSSTSGFDNLEFQPVGGATSPQKFAIDFSHSTQFDIESSKYTNSANGYPAGKPVTFNIDNDGKINVYYSNQQSRVEGQIAVAKFASPQGLIKINDMSWISSTETGDAILDVKNSEGVINPNSVEFSNVDLTEELVKLIGAQHDFQANAQVQQTYNQLLQTIENI